MFTGLVEERGRVVRVTDLNDDSKRLRIYGPKVTADVAAGDSICVSGVCLTVVDPHDEEFSADVMSETLLRSGLGQVRPGTEVNLERAMALGDRFGGHVVAGHVDGRAEVLQRQDSQHWRVLRFTLPAELAPMVAEKGSITLDGVSLTIVDASAEEFSVSLIPTTLQETTLGSLEPGDRVNVEVDVLARYVARALAVGS